MTYPCMSPDELALWREGAAAVRNGGSKPCVDCPLAFHQAEKLAGRCDRPFRPIGPLTSEERAESVRLARQRYRETHRDKIRVREREYQRRRRMLGASAVGLAGVT